MQSNNFNLDYLRNTCSKYSYIDFYNPGRPRVYIVQACRGLKYQEGVATDAAPYSEDRSLASVDIKVPKDSDTLIAHSTIEGTFLVYDRGFASTLPINIFSEFSTTQH